MNGEGEKGPPEMNRRGFLKKAGAVLAGVVAAKVLTGCGSEKGSWGSFREIGEGEKILLKKNGEEIEIEIRYDPEMKDKIGAEHFLQERKSGDIPFGTETPTNRMLGEKFGKEIVEVEVAEGYDRVNLHATGGKLFSIKDRTTEMKPGVIYTALRVATEAQDWTGEGTLPEYEEQRIASDRPGISKVSQGYAVGRLEDNVFTILGYVCDPRVIQEVQK